MDLDALKADLVRDEGSRLFPYTDTAGKLTIGIGHNLTDRGISQAVCDAIFAEDIAAVISDLDRELPWWTRLDEPRQRVLANMAFNLGIARLLLFKKMLDHLARGEYGAAADEMVNSKWANDVGPRAQRLETVMRGTA